MNVEKTLREIGENLDTIDKKVAWLIQRNQELEQENSALKDDIKIFREYAEGKINKYKNRR